MPSSTRTEASPYSPDSSSTTSRATGMKTHPGVAAKTFEVMAEHGINIEMISTSTIRISCVIRAEEVERAVQVLHSAFGLDD